MLVLSVVTILALQNHSYLPEDPSQVAESLRKTGAWSVTIEGTDQKVVFPKGMTEQEIAQDMDKHYAGKDLASVRRISEQRMGEYTKRTLEENREHNESLRTSNLRVIGWTLALWAALVVILYSGGWCIAWVRQGFRK